MKVFITISQNGVSPMMLINRDFCTCKTVKGLKMNITKKYNSIYNNCRNYFGHGNCVVSFTNQESIELAKLNINVL